MELVRVPSTFLFLAHCWLALWDVLQICLGAVTPRRPHFPPVTWVSPEPVTRVPSCTGVRENRPVAVVEAAGQMLGVRMGAELYPAAPCVLPPYRLQGVNLLHTQAQQLTGELPRLPSLSSEGE